MIHFVKGTLFDDDCEALVNTVNCVGVMGKGVALQFKERFPENYKAYRRACATGEVRLGKIFAFSTDTFEKPRWILNFPTKRHWKEHSRIEYIVSGLNDLAEFIRRNDIRSVALPPLGCGLGRLEWAVVKPLIVTRFSKMSDVHVYVHEPEAAPTVGVSGGIPEKTIRMTPVRAAFVALAAFCQNNVFDPVFTLLKAHKVLYFLQCQGAQLRLKYEKAHYGPYATNLCHVLTQIEGHFLTGFTGNDLAPHVKLNVLSGAITGAKAVLVGEPELLRQVHNVEALVEGFESTSGMELLATVHWVCTREGAVNADNAYEKICQWSSRKARMFSREEVVCAFARLKQNGWLVSGITHDLARHIMESQR